MRVRAFQVPKKGAGAEECEDAFAFSQSHSSGDAVLFRAAVADGATESAFARHWAWLLAERFAGCGPATLTEELAALQDEWADAVDARAGTLPWYAAAKAADGAFATLLGLTLRPGADGAPGTWQADSVGDSNLFHFGPDGALVQAWPRAEAAQFGTRPALVPSRPEATVPEATVPEATVPEARRAEGPFAPGDAFVLATDAAAAWLLRRKARIPRGRTGPAGALRWSDQAAFAEAVRHARAEGLLKNDDTTVVTVQTA